MALNAKQKEMQSYLEMQNQLQDRYDKTIASITDKEKLLDELQQSRADRQQTINELQRNYDELTAKQKKSLEELVKLQNSEYLKLKDLTKEQKALNEQVDKEVKARQKVVDLATVLVDQLKLGWTYLQSQDKIIKATILNLGMSGAKADMMRTSFEDSANFVTRLGGSLEDVQTIMEGYADETGRARALSSDMVKDITLIGKGTGLGIENATKLGAQFELMGFNAKGAMDYVQGVVDTSERMGVNTTKVLKNISDNFKKLNTYNFQQGVKGFAQMAEYAEKFKIDIGDALNAADTARTLEGAIDMVAKLQVMGGEFAKMDMFETLYFARNDPAKLQAKIADMTKGLVTLRKTSDGTFEKFISPADRDRLAQAGKALGIDAAKMTEMSERAFDIEKMSKQLQGIGLSDKQKELVEGAAIFNKENGKFEVQLAGKMKDISSLTREQADAFVKEKKSLEDRAKNAQTFDEVFKATIETLKASLLPLLKNVNWLLDHTIKPIADMAAKGWGIAGAAAALGGAALLWKGASMMFSKGVDNFIKGGVGNIFKGGTTAKGGGFLGKMFGGGTAKAATAAEGAAGGAGPSFGSGAGAGLKGLGTGAGIGAAAVGLGAGVGLAAEGISKLADSMSKLTKDQAENLKSIAMTLAITFPLAAIGIGIVAAVAAPAAIPLLALGAAVAMVGAGMYLATTGIGNMAEGLSKLVTAGKDAGPSMLTMGAGIAAMGAGMALFTAGGLGMLVFAGTMKTIAKNADAMAKVGDAFGNIKAVMSGSKDDFIAVQNAVESISKMNTSGGGMLADLAKLLKEPLKVQFADNGKVTLQNDVTLNLNGEKFMHNVYNSVIAIEKQQALKTGQAGK